MSLMSMDNTVVRRFGSLVKRLRSSRSGETDTQLAAITADLSSEDTSLLRDTIDQALNPRTAPETARARAAEIGAAYLALSDEGKGRFFDLLATEYGVDNTEVDAAIGRRSAITDPVEAARANADLRRVLEPARIRLLRYFNGLDSGVKFLVDMRADVRRLGSTTDASGNRVRIPERQVLGEDLHGLLSGWFDIGLLNLQRITWDTPAAVLEKLIQYEAVHDIASWDDLKRRMAPDRRLFAFFHPGMPNEPLIFVEVALVVGLADAIEPLLDPNEPIDESGDADTAIFYSISNCQPGLAGVPLGDFLIKRVVAEVQTNLPDIQVFSTLSPMPGFHGWVDQLIDDDALRGDEAASIKTIASTDSWWTDTELVKRVEPAMMGLAARYLITERANGRVVDSVARFHLSNGARVERLLFLANPTARGQERGLGMMVNYRYLPKDLDANQRAYLNRDEVIASDAVQDLLAPRDDS